MPGCSNEAESGGGVPQRNGQWNFLVRRWYQREMDMARLTMELEKASAGGSEQDSNVFIYEEAESEKLFVLMGGPQAFAGMLKAERSLVGTRTATNPLALAGGSNIWATHTTFPHFHTQA